jgi:hypothetical protein
MFIEILLRPKNTYDFYISNWKLNNTYLTKSISKPSFIYDKEGVLISELRDNFMIFLMGE